MPPKKQAFTMEQEFLLIHAVKNRPQLWDVSHPMYRRNDIKETLWQEVANFIGPHVTVEIARERFINMRTTFMNNEKRIRESKQRCSGKGADEIYKPKWSLYTNLLFLKKACVQTESSSNLDVFEDDDNQACITTTDTNEEINNNLLAHSVKKNIYFDSNLQKWILASANNNNTDEPSYSQTSCEDSSTMVLNQSLLEHTYSADKIQQSSIKKILLSTPSPTSICSSPIPNERVGSLYTSPSSSEGACTLDVINSEPLAFENQRNVHLTSVSPSPSPNSTFVVQDKKQAGEDSVFVKRCAKKKKTTIMEEAVEALKKISNEKMPQVSQSPLHTPNTADAYEHLGLFIAARLRDMEADIRLRCEIEIMKILTTVATVETPERNT